MSIHSQMTCLNTLELVAIWLTVDATLNVVVEPLLHYLPVTNVIVSLCAHGIFQVAFARAAVLIAV